MPTPSALHSKKTPKWGTPEKIIEIARLLMGGIHLDPGSSEEFNQFVRALMIYTEKDDGLAPSSEWAGNVFCNPPGGLVNEFWMKLIGSWLSGQVEKAFWVGFSVEQLCTLADMEYHPLDFSTCILRKRLNFQQLVETPIYEEPKEIQGLGEVERIIIGYEPPKIIEGTSPSHGNYVTAIGCDPAEFEKLLSSYGKISHGRMIAKSLTA